jgi:TPR repeat protein
MPDPDHFTIEGFGSYERVTDPRSGDLPCSTENPFHVTADFARRRAAQAEARNDAKNAFCWATISASGGSEDGEALLGGYYFNGYGGPKDLQAAVTWTTKGATAGSVLGYLNLAYFYEHGYGVVADVETAKKWRYYAASRKLTLDEGNDEDASADIAILRRAFQAGSDFLMQSAIHDIACPSTGAPGTAGYAEANENRMQAVASGRCN